jgi:3-isopropylmalate dehydratase small subunit
MKKLKMKNGVKIVMMNEVKEVKETNATNNQVITYKLTPEEIAEKFKNIKPIGKKLINIHQKNLRSGHSKQSK